MQKFYFKFLLLILVIYHVNAAPIGSASNGDIDENVKRQIYQHQTNSMYDPYNMNNNNNNNNNNYNQQNGYQNNNNNNNQVPFWQVNPQNPNNLNLIHNNQYWPGPDPATQQNNQNNNNNNKAYVYPLKPVFPEFVTTTTTTTTTDRQDNQHISTENPEDVPLYSKSFNPYDRETQRPTPLTPQALWYSRYADLTVPIAAVPFNTWNNI